MLTPYLSILQLHALFLPIAHHRFVVEATKKRKVCSAYNIRLTHPILTKTSKNDYFLAFFTFTVGRLFPKSQIHLYFTTPESASKSCLTLKVCLKVSTKIKFIVRLYRALEQGPVSKSPWLPPNRNLFLQVKWNINNHFQNYINSPPAAVLQVILP